MCSGKEGRREVAEGRLVVRRGEGEPCSGRGGRREMVGREEGN